VVRLARSDENEFQHLFRDVRMDEQMKADFS
jgi:hypothetical protein